MINVRLNWDKLINEKIIAEPEKSVPDIYHEVKESYTQNMDSDIKESFLKNFPEYKKIAWTLQQKRKTVTGEKTKTIKKKTDPEKHFYPRDIPLPEHKFYIRNLNFEMQVISSKSLLLSPKATRR